MSRSKDPTTQLIAGARGFLIAAVLAAALALISVVHDDPVIIPWSGWLGTMLGSLILGFGCLRRARALQPPPGS